MHIEVNAVQLKQVTKYKYVSGMILVDGKVQIMKK